MSWRTPGSFLYVVFTAAVVCSVYLLRMNPAVGLMVDDAAYMVLGKAIAEGQGYRLVSSPVAILPSCPPGFPLLLSVVFWFSHEFPQNVWLLKSISIDDMLGVGALESVYLHP